MISNNVKVDKAIDVKIVVLDWLKSASDDFCKNNHTFMTEQNREKRDSFLDMMDIFIDHLSDNM